MIFKQIKVNNIKFSLYASFCVTGYIKSRKLKKNIFSNITKKTIDLRYKFSFSLYLERKYDGVKAHEFS